MSEPTYGSGQYDPQQGYGGQQQYGGQQYGGQPSGQSPYPTGQQPQQQPPTYGGGYGQQPQPQQQPGGYPSGSYPASSPTTSKTPQDKLALAATIVTIVGYVCAGAGVLGFIFYLAADSFSTAAKLASALVALATGLGLGGINYAIGTWLGSKPSSSSTS